MNKSINDYKKEFLLLIQGSDHNGAMRTLDYRLQLIQRSWDSIIYKNGQYVRYDYERKHRSKEEYGDVLTKEEANQYLAIKEIKEDLMSGKLKRAQPTWTY